MTNSKDFQETIDNIIEAAMDMYPIDSDEAASFHAKFSTEIAEAAERVYIAQVDFDEFCEAQESKGKYPPDVRGFKIRYQRATNPIVQNTAKVYFEQAQYQAQRHA